MTLGSRDQGLLIGLGTAAIGAAAWFFWLSPTTLGLQQANSQLQQLDQQKATLASRLSFVDATTKDLAENPEAVRLLNLAAPTTGGMENLLASFDAMAIASGVTLASFQPATASDQPTQLTLTVSISGSYPAIQAFVAALESNIRPFAIQTLTLSSASGVSGPSVVTGSLSVTTPMVAATPIEAAPSSSTQAEGTQ